jgi:hypothetical protein
MGFIDFKDGATTDDLTNRQAIGHNASTTDKFFSAGNFIDSHRIIGFFRGGAQPQAVFAC